MLKYWLALLVLLNAAVLAWQWDAFARWGYGPNQDREPERLQQQVRPEALTLEVVPPAAADVTAPSAQASEPANPATDAAPPAPVASAPASSAPAAAPGASSAAPTAAPTTPR